MASKTVYPSLGAPDGRVLPKFSKHDTIAETAKATLVGSLFGLNVVLVRHSLSPSRSFLKGFSGKLGPIPLLGAVGAAYSFGQCVSANLREEESAVNAATGGALAGAIAGATQRRPLAKSLGGAILLGFVCAAFDWGFDRGHKESVLRVTSEKQELSEDHPRQGFWELVHRRPLSHTVEELGDLAKQFVRD